MATIDDVVKVTIVKEANTTTIRDLNTILILSEHENFTDDFRIYTNLSDMIDDGFLTTEFAYIAAQRVFAQDPRPSKVVVGVKDDAETYVEAIVRTRAATAQWIFLVTDAATDAEKEAIADYVETTDIKYVYSDSNEDTLTSDTTNLPAKLKAKSYDNSFAIYRKDAAVAAEAAYVGRFSSEVIGSNLWIYKELDGLVAESFTATEESFLQAHNIQYYTTVNGDPVVFGNGVVAGGEFIDVILGALWIKIRMQEALWLLFKTNSKILYTNGGIALIEAKIIEVLKLAVKYNILTEDDPLQISVPNANTVGSTQRATRVLKDVTFRARLAGAIQKIDGIVGTIYA